MDADRISYSPDMGALVRAQYVAKQQAQNPVPYFPSRRHLERGLAPERTLGEQDLQALAQAQRIAQEQGVLPPEVAQYMLPMAMVEGRPGNYGVIPNNRFYASPQNMSALQKMGLEIGEGGHFITKRDQRGDKFLHMNPDRVQGEDAHARVMAAILAMKHRGRGPEEAVMGYNGRGEQARHYLGKVQTALELLQHESNAKLRQHFQKYLGQK